jgi:hypothetical protein
MLGEWVRIMGETTINKRHPLYWYGIREPLQHGIYGLYRLKRSSVRTRHLPTSHLLFSSIARNYSFSLPTFVPLESAPVSLLVQLPPLRSLEHLPFPIYSTWAVRSSLLNSLYSAATPTNAHPVTDHRNLICLQPFLVLAFRNPHCRPIQEAVWLEFYEILTVIFLLKFLIIDDFTKSYYVIYFIFHAHISINGICNF